MQARARSVCVWVIESKNLSTKTVRSIEATPRATDNLPILDLVKTRIHVAQVSVIARASSSLPPPLSTDGVW